MSNVAIRYWSDFAEGDRKGPIIWPAWIREIGNAESYSEGGYTWYILSIEDYRSYITTHQEDYDSWKAALPVNMIALITAAIPKAAAYGNKIMTEFCAENVFQGITIPQVLVLVDKLHKVIDLISSGSLASAISAIDDVTTDEYFCTAARKLSMQQKLQDYLDGNAS